jgi:hypothetical protein
MLIHPELMFWYKCPSCGFSELNVALYKKSQNICIYTKHINFLIQQSVCATKEQCDCPTSLQTEQTLLGHGLRKAQTLGEQDP